MHALDRANGICSGGETEFLELLVAKGDTIEPVCKECHVVRQLSLFILHRLTMIQAWHNHPINIPHLDHMVYRPG